MRIVEIKPFLFNCYILTHNYSINRNHLVVSFRNSAQPVDMPEWGGGGGAERIESMEWILLANITEIYER